MQMKLEFSNLTKNKVNRKKKKQDNQKNEYIKFKKVHTIKPHFLESNITALEKIRKKQFPSEVFNIELPDILSPEEITSLFYISYQKEINKEKIKNIINKKINNLKNIFLKRETEIDLKRFEELQNEIFTKEESFQDFIDYYTELYEKINIKPITPSNEMLNFHTIFSIFPIKIIEKNKMNIFTNKITPIIKSLPSNQFNFFFTEPDYLKSYIANQSINAIKIGDNFSTSLKDINNKSIDIAILFIQEKKVKIEDEDSLEIRKNCISKKLIENNLAKEGIITYEAIHPKMRNYGISIVIGPSDIVSSKKLNFKKHEIVAIPLITIYFFDKNERININKEAVNIKTGKKETVKTNKAITIFCTMKEKDFLKSPIKQEIPEFFIENFDEITKIKDLAEFESVHNSIEYLNKVKNNIEAKKIITSMAKHLSSQLKSSKNLLLSTMIEEIATSIEKEDPLKINPDNYIRKIINYTKNEKRINNLIKIHILRKSKASIISPIHEKIDANLRELSEKLFMKLKSEDKLLFLHLEIISDLITDKEKRYISHEITLGGMHKSEGQKTYAKPFEYLFLKNDFIDLIFHVSTNFKRKNDMIEYIKNKLKLIKKVKTNPQPGLEQTRNDILEIVNKVTRKEFKTLTRAFDYLFSYNENITLDRKAIIYFEKNVKNPNIKYFIEIIKNIENGYSLKVIKHNEKSKIYSEMPSIIQKIKDIYTYIENKEDVVSKVAIKKTLEKINALEEEIENLKK